MEAISLLASLAQLIDAAGKVIRYLHDVKDAPKARAQIAQEASLLVGFLTSLRLRLQYADAQDPWVTGVLSLAGANGPLAQFKEVLNLLEKKLLDPANSGSTRKALKWPFEKKEVSEWLQRMERLKSFVLLALQGDIL